MRKHQRAQLSQVHFAVMWWLACATGIFRAPVSALLAHKEEIRDLLRIILPIKCQTGSNVSFFRIFPT